MTQRNKTTQKKTTPTTTKSVQKTPARKKSRTKKNNSKGTAVPKKSHGKKTVAQDSQCSVKPSDQVLPKTQNKEETAIANLVDCDMVLSALPHPIFILNPEQQFIYVTGAAEAFFETSRSMLKRMTLADVVNFSNPLRTLVNQVRDMGTTVNEYAVEITTKRFESPKLVDLYAGPIPEKPYLTIVMLLQRAMAQKIERQLTHRAAARSVSGMASVLAHEIKNPLSGIRGAAQLLEQNLSDEDRALTRLICTETDRIKALVDRMEVFGDERPISRSPVNIHDVLEHVRILAQAGFAKGISVVEEYDPSLPPVPGNRDQLIQAFLNLIKNAAEALGGNKTSDRITIQTSFRPGVRMMVPGAETRIALPLMIEIEDNGKGVPEHLKAHLFDPFVTTKTGGTGLGLALVAKIIGDHGGVIECESENNKTVFRVLLPLQTGQTRDTPQHPEEHANNLGNH